MQRLASVVGVVVGGAGVVWGAVLAALDGQPGLVMAAGFGAILLSMMGSNWTEIAAKFGDKQMTIKRQLNAVAAPAVEALEEAASEVKASSRLPKDEQAKLVKRLEAAQDSVLGIAGWAALNTAGSTLPRIVVHERQNSAMIQINNLPTDRSRLRLRVVAPDGKVSESSVPVNYVNYWPFEPPALSEAPEGRYEVLLLDRTVPNVEVALDRTYFTVRDGRVHPLHDFAKGVIARMKPSAPQSSAPQ